MIRFVVLLAALASVGGVVPAAAGAAARPAPARVLVADAGLVGAAPLARLGFGRSYGFGSRSRYGYGGRGYGYRSHFGFGRRGHGFVHGLFWGFLLGHWFSGGGFPIFGFLLIGLFAWSVLRRRRRSRWSTGY